jgi:hypothetical protein
MTNDGLRPTEKKDRIDKIDILDSLVEPYKSNGKELVEINTTTNSVGK